MLKCICLDILENLLDTEIYKNKSTRSVLFIMLMLAISGPIGRGVICLPFSPFGRDVVVIHVTWFPLFRLLQHFIRADFVDQFLNIM